MILTDTLVKAEGEKSKGKSNFSVVASNEDSQERKHQTEKKPWNVRDSHCNSGSSL